MTHSTKSVTKPAASFDAIGTRWQIEAPKSVPITAIHQRVKEYDEKYSRFRDDSVVAAISRQPGVYRLPTDAETLLYFYKQMYDISDGLVTPLIGQTISDAGYDKAYSLQPESFIADVPSWKDSLYYAHPNLTVLQPCLLDFGAAGKGHLVDIISEYIDGDYCINAGGDLRVQGNQAIGLEHPDNFDEVIGIAEFSRGSLCGSAGNRRTWANYTHIIDPRSKTSPTKIKAVWVYAETALIADGISTCLFFIGPEVLQNTFDFEYVIMYADNSATISANFPGKLF